MGNTYNELQGGIPFQPGDTLHGLAGTAAVINCIIYGVEVFPPTLDRGVPQSYINKQLAMTQLDTADAILYTVPSGPCLASLMSQIFLVNTSASPVSGVKLGINGTAATAANQLLSGLTIPANGYAVFVDGVLRVYDSGGNLYQTSTAISFDSTLPAVTVPLTLTGVVGTAATAAHRDHQHQSPGGVASIIAASAAIVDTETQVVAATMPAGILQAGTVLRFKAFGFITSTADNVVTFRVRIGTTTLTGNIPASLAVHCGNSGTVTAAGFILEVTVTIRTAGAGGTCYGVGYVLSLSSGSAVSQALALANELFTPASVAVDTTAIKIAELTCVTAVNTTAVTFQSATLEVVKM